MNDNNIFETLLDMEIIYFLPKYKIINDKSLLKQYMHCIDSVTLSIIIENHKANKLEFIQSLFNIEGTRMKYTQNEEINDSLKRGEQIIKQYKIIQPNIYNIKVTKYYDQFIELKKQMENINKEIYNISQQIKSENLKLNNFNCLKNLKNDEKTFSNYILNCSDMSNKNINWYDIILGKSALDELYEKEIEKTTYELGLTLNTINPIIDRLSDNDHIQFKEILKQRLLLCRYKKELTIFQKWKSYFVFIPTEIDVQKCNQCHNKCILYLNKYF